MIYKPGLYIVSTPIGNLDDITFRAVDVLKHSDIIFCEDTRVSNKLLAKHDICSSLKLYNDNSVDNDRKYIKQLVSQGKIISLISDAGTPLISDPGYKLIKYLKDENIHLDIAPGPCAAIAALSLSGLPTDKFLFSGFLPKTQEKKAKLFQELSSMKVSLIFYESPRRLLSSLLVALEILGDRKCCVSRELTKLFQESNTAHLSELIDHYTKIPAKGEVVLSIAGQSDLIIDNNLLENEILQLFKNGDSAKSVAEILYDKYKSNYRKKEIYKIVNQIKIDISSTK